MDNNKRILLKAELAKLALTIVAALGLVILIVLFVSDDPVNALFNFFIGPFQSLRRIGNIIEGALPLVFTALAVVMIFGAGTSSLIAEGSFFMGALGAMIVALTLDLPNGIHPIVALAVSAALGAVLATIPAILKVKWKVAEIVTSLMLNYVGQFFVVFMLNYYFREANSANIVSRLFPDTSRLAVVVEGTRIHSGVLIGVILCIVIYLLLYKTTFGVKLRITGDNAGFSHYSGIKVAKITVLAQIIGGAIAGLGGGVELLGMYDRFKWTATPGYGWTGIAVALLARYNPLLVPIAAMFMGYLNVGANIMARSSDVSSDVVSIIQGVIMLLIASEALLSKWKQKMIAESAQQEAEKKGEVANV